MIDTIILEYKQTLGKALFNEHATGQQWYKEKEQREQARQDLKDLQEYMVSKGFEIHNDKVIDSSGIIHTLKA